MKPAWSRYRYAPQNLVLLGALGLVGGWAGVSGFMMALLWVNAPEKQERLVSLLERMPFVFFPPLFPPPLLYILAAFSILFVCGALMLLVRLATRTTNQEQ